MKTGIGTIFIPYQMFDGDFLSILDDLVEREIITWTEREMLRILNKFAYKDGKCYPSQKRLEKEIGLGNSQVRNILRKLEKNCFIRIDRPAPIQRRLFRKQNRYFFLWHAAYMYVTDTEKNVVPGTRSDTEAPYKENQKISKSLKTPALPDLSSESATETAPDREIRERIDALCRKILITVSGENRFDPYMFSRTNLRNYVPEAITYALEAILKKAGTCGGNPALLRQSDFWGYGRTVLRREGRNLSEARHRAQARKHAEDLKAVAERFFGDGGFFPAFG